MASRESVRRARAVAAGAGTALKRLLLVALLVAVGLPLARCMASVYVRGTPAASFGSDSPASYGRLPVRDASPAEAEAVRSAFAGLRYRFDAAAFDVGVVEASETASVRQGAEYLGGGMIRLRRDIVQLGGPALSWALAHEVGHYVDETYMRDDAREAFMRMRGIPEYLSWDGIGVEWERRPAEDFADTFAARSQDPPSDTATTYYGRISQPREVEDMLTALGLRLGVPPEQQTPAEAAPRDAELYLDFLSQPFVAVPLLAGALVYVVVGAFRRSKRTWWRLAA
jgi:hypothetical protein